MTIKIVTDSASDLPQEIVERYDIIVVPLHIHIGDQDYQDGVDLSRQEFYERLPTYSEPPMTATPSPGQFAQVYEELTAQGATEILSIHIAPSLSGVLNAARLGAEEAETASVTVLDSGQLSMGVGFLVIRAAEAVEAGHSMAEIVALLEDQIERSYVFAVTDTFDYLRRGGRVSLLQYHLGSLLRIAPLLKMYAGKATAGIVRHYRRGVDHLTDMVEDLGPLERVALLHANVPEQAARLRERLAEILPAGQEMLMARVNPTIGVHVGPGCVGVACVVASQR